MPDYQDNFKDYRGVVIQVNWSERLWNEHLNKHPEIQNLAHASKLISEAVSAPSLVITGYKPPDGKEKLICYYREYKTSGTDVYYSKVVVGCSKSPIYVKTIFLRWALCEYAVQEKKYGFKEIHRDIKTIL